MVQFDEFTAAYVETALWTSADVVEGIYDTTSIDDFAPETIDKIISDCKRFQADNADDLDDDNCLSYGPDFGPAGRAGHDFWLTRNGHGAGFWDGDWKEPAASRLTEASKAFGETDLYVGDDGLLYLFDG